MVLRTWCLLVFLACCCTCYRMTWGPVYSSFDQKYDDLQPQDVMVDYINRLGLYLLNVHNEDNLHNNIALSPYGAVSVLIALAEGLRGDAALEIYRASHIPHDLTIIRIGLRDIHRHLKTYFIPREGFLAGLTLSHDNVTLSPSYERILRFYGYDLESFHGVRMPAASPSVAPPGITPFPPPDARTEPRVTEETTPVVVVPQTEAPRVTEEAVTIPVVEITTAPPTPEVMTVPVASTTQPPTVLEASTVPPTVLEAATVPPTVLEAVTVPPTTARIVSEPAMTVMMTTVKTTTRAPVTIPVVVITEPEPTVKAASPEPTTVPPVAQTTTESTSESTTPEEPSSSTDSPTTSREPDTFVAVTTESEAELITTAAPEAATVETLQALRANVTAKRSNITGRIEMITAINIQTTKVSPKSEEDADGNAKRNQRSIIDYLIARYYDDYYIPKKHHYPKFHPRIPFFIDGIHRIDRAHFMTYDTVLPFFYMANMEALALSFPLDSTNYYLLLILPLREDGIDDLICDLKRNPDLKYIIRNMKYTHVKAIIPSFTLKGHVNLTPSFQRLGIQKIFEPHHADFTPMTNSKDVYVTNIEQAITVTIRNYVDLGFAADHGDHYGPVEFKADHPFLYFVMDSQMHVALMAGKIIDPLNFRIR